MADQPLVGEVLADITADIRTIVRGEIELAKAEVIPGAKKAGVGAVILMAAGAVAAFALFVLLLCLGFVFAALYWDHTATPVGAFAFGFLTAFGVYLLLAIILAVVGFVLVKKLHKPASALNQNEQTLDTLQQATTAGFANVRQLMTFGRKKIARDDTGQIVTLYSGPKRAVEGPSSP